MALWHCASCGTAYAVGLSRCPQCGSTKYEEDAVPKITYAGPSVDDAHADVSAAPAVPESESDSPNAASDASLTPDPEPAAAPEQEAAPAPEPAPTAPATVPEPPAVPKPPAPPEVPGG